MLRFGWAWAARGRGRRRLLGHGGRDQHAADLREGYEDHRLETREIGRLGRQQPVSQLFGLKPQAVDFRAQQSARPAKRVVEQRGNANEYGPVQVACEIRWHDILSESAFLCFSTLVTGVYGWRQGIFAKRIYDAAVEPRRLHYVATSVQQKSINRLLALPL